jgi:hypothetical protein
MQIPCRFWIIRLWLELNDEIILDSKDGVVDEVWVVAWEELCYDLLVAIGGDHEMDVGGSHWVTVEHLEHCPRWTCRV